MSEPMGPTPRPDMAMMVGILGIAPDNTLKIAYLESCLNVEWWRGYKAGAIAAFDEAKQVITKTD